MGRVVIMRARPSDAGAMARVFVKAFGHRGPLEPVVTNFGVSMEVQPDGCFVALLNSSVIGTGCFFDYGRVAWVGNVAVVPELQRRGVGTAIMLRILGELRARGVETVRLDATEQGRRLYRKLGFVEEYHTIMYRLSREASEEVSYGGVEVLDELPEFALEFDRRAFGADRTHVLASWVRRRAKVLVVARDGYALLRKGFLGPVIARSYGVAKTLVTRAIRLGAQRMIVPSASRDAVRLVEELGAEEVTRCIRMRLGPMYPKDVGGIYGILGCAKG